MTITLRPDQEQLLLDIMRAGGYENAEEAIGSALEILHLQKEWLSENGSLVDAKIREESRNWIVAKASQKQNCLRIFTA